VKNPAVINLQAKCFFAKTVALKVADFKNKQVNDEFTVESRNSLSCREFPPVAG
jgi:hypothetical protein